MAGDFIDPFAGPSGGRLRPPQRPGPVAWVVAAVVVVLVVAFLVVNR